MNVLLLGAGGSARAVAFHVADRLGRRVSLLISDRTSEPAVSLAVDINKTSSNAEAVAETEIFRFAPTVGLIINSTDQGPGRLT